MPTGYPKSPRASRMPLALGDGWERQFDPACLDRGRELARNGAVTTTAVSDKGYRLDATMEDGSTVVVKLMLQIAAGIRVGGECTCGEALCEHAAASLFVGLNVHGASTSRRRQRAVELRPAVSVASPVEPVPAPEDEEKPELELWWIVSPKQRNVGLRVEMLAGAEGTPAEAKRKFDSTLWRKEFPDHRLSQEDASLVAALTGSRVFYEANHELVGDRGGELLERLLHTGRVRLGSPGNPPLRRASPADVAVSWQRRPDASVAPNLEVAGLGGVTVVEVAGLWYFHHDSAQCGWASGEIPSAVLLEWQSMEPLNPAEMVAHCDWLTSEYPEADLPLPKMPTVRECDGIVPVPCLCFRSWTAEGAPESRLDGAALSFDYEGARVSADSESDYADRWTGSDVLRTRRDFRGEAKFRGRIERLGFFYACDEDSSLLSLESGGGMRWTEFIHAQVPRLEADGWRIEWDESFRYRFAPVEEWFVEAQKDGDWFSLELGVFLDGERVDLLAALVGTIREIPDLLLPGTLESLPPTRLVPVPLPDGRMAGMPISRLRPVLETIVEFYSLELLRDGGRIRVDRLRAAELAGLEGRGFRWMGGDDLRDLHRRLKNYGGLRDVALPEGFRAELRHYQREGVAWLQFLREHALAGVLADDMGLGKTIQTLAHLLIERESGRADRPSLVVAPTSLMSNWQSEAERFAPGLRVLVYHGADRRDRLEAIARQDVVVTTYALLVRDLDALAGRDWHCVVLDEAQYVKNARSRASAAVRELRARHRLCLTGTPMENHLGELWALFDFLLPGFLGEERQFRRIFRDPIEKADNGSRRDLLARRVAPFLLRRTKERVLSELPAKTEMIRTVEFEGPQRDLYESIRVAMHDRIRGEVEARGLARSQIVILDALLKLRQVCCDPRLVKMESASKVTESAKLGLLMDLLPDLVEDGRRILVFSQFTSMLALIEAELKKRRIRHVTLTGSTKDRKTPVDEFQRGDVPVFLISLKAGGTGLNLTAADTVIHYDPWWNPAVESQATDRAHRMGQEKPVFVYRLIVKGSVEEKIAVLQEKKRALVAGLLGEGKGDRLKLSDDELEALFEPLPPG